jgi:8-oxo-dGTP pyrophosphatase MutT (NUDIX family)
MMTITTALEKLLDLLPLHAEEGRVRERAREGDIIGQLGCVEASATVKVIRRIFESAQLLDRQELDQGYWAFVSFPASLLGRSLISTWATPDQSLADSEYWEDQSYVEEQRALLHELETRRAIHSGNLPARPIRFVHVAWGLIRLGGYFLLNNREDKPRIGEKRYVFPGGKLRTDDLPFESRNSTALRSLFTKKSLLAQQCLPKTLRRELNEELGLRDTTDYTFTPWMTLGSYCAVGGTGNRRALSNFDIAIFRIQLTQQGLIKLLEKISKDPENNLWFSIEELKLGKRPDGADAYIDAMRNDLGDRLSVELGSIPDSSSTPYAFADETSAVDLPECASSSFRRGKTGKEKEFHFALSQFAWELVLLLGWCTRGLMIQPNADRVLVLGGGWIRLCQDGDVAAAKELANAMAACDFPLLEFAGNGLRLSIDPSHLYFSERLFCYDYKPQGSGGVVDLRVNDVKISLGELRGTNIRIQIPRNIATVIEAIEAGRNPASIREIQEAKALPRQNRESLTSFTREIGLRRLIRMPGSELSKDLEMFIDVPKARI